MGSIAAYRGDMCHVRESLGVGSALCWGGFVVYYTYNEPSLEDQGLPWGGGEGDGWGCWMKGEEMCLSFVFVEVNYKRGWYQGCYPNLPLLSCHVLAYGA